MEASDQSTKSAQAVNCSEYTISEKSRLPLCKKCKVEISEKSKQSLFKRSKVSCFISCCFKKKNIINKSNQNG